MKNMFYIKPVICSLMLVTFILSSCEKKRMGYELEYLPVQMSMGDSWSIIDKNGKVVVEEEYPSDATVFPIVDGVYWVKQDGTYQLYSIKNPKLPLIDEEFTHVTMFGDGCSAVSAPNIPIRIINTQGKIVATLSQDIKSCSQYRGNGYAIVQSFDKKHGIIDTEGNIVIEPQYSSIALGEDVFFATSDNDGDDVIRIIDYYGKELAVVKDYDPIGNVMEGKFLAVESNKEGPITVFDKTGKELFRIKNSVQDQSSSESYLDGYIVYKAENDMYGVIDKDGKSVIRAKYELMYNNSNGDFIAKKGNKFGVVNAKDKTILPFNFDFVMASLGSNYVVANGDHWALVNKNGKELTTFYRPQMFGLSDNAVYINVDKLINSIVEDIAEYETPSVARKSVEGKGLSPEECRYDRGYETNITYGGNAKLSANHWFDDRISKEKTHTVEENDGWFTTTRTVSDGWEWTDAQPTHVEGRLSILDPSLKVEDLFCKLCKKMSEGRFVISEGVYSQKVNLGNKTLTCKTTLAQVEDYIDIDITFDGGIRKEVQHEEKIDTVLAW